MKNLNKKKMNIVLKTGFYAFLIFIIFFRNINESHFFLSLFFLFFLFFSVVEHSKSIKESFYKLKDKRMLIPFFSDIVFLFFYGLIVLPLLDRVVDYVMAIGYHMSKSSGEITRQYIATESILNALLSNPDILSYFKKIVVLFFIIVIAVYVVYCLFQGISWKICYGKTKYNYIKQFFLINIFWVLIFVVQQLVSLFFDLRMAVIKSINPSVVAKTNPVPTIILVVIVYFALVSYALVGKLKVREALKKCFVTGIKKFKDIGLMYVFVVAMFFVLNRVLFAVGRINNILMIVLGVLLVIPAFSFTRLFIIDVVGNILKNKK